MSNRIVTYQYTNKRTPTPTTPTTIKLEDQTLKPSKVLTYVCFS
jgi:hypothetical protein